MTAEPLDERLTLIITRILALLFGRRMDGIWQPVTLNGHALFIVNQTLCRVRTRFAAVLRRIENGTLRKPPRRNPATTPRPPPETPPKPRLEWPFRLRNTPGWLQRIIKPVHYLNVQISRLHTLVRDPELQRLIQQAPQIRRILRPLCVMMGVEPPALQTLDPAVQPRNRRGCRTYDLPFFPRLPMPSHGPGAVPSNIQNFA